MSQFLKKNAKLFNILFLVFGFLFIVLACVFMTPYYQITVKFDNDFLTGEIPSLVGANANLNTFCKGTYSFFVTDGGQTFAGGAYKPFYDYMYNLMFDCDQLLQAANDMVLSLAVVILVMGAIMMICSNHSRKKFYISNLVSGVACPAIAIIVAVITLVLTLRCVPFIQANFNSINWGALGNSPSKEISDAAIELCRAGDTSQFLISTKWLIIYSVFYVVFIVAAVLLMIYNISRYMDTKKQLAAEEAVA